MAVEGVTAGCFLITRDIRSAPSAGSAHTGHNMAPKWADESVSNQIWSLLI
jgi:hypothetical protein